MEAAAADTGGRAGRRPSALGGLLASTAGPATPLRTAAAVLVVVAVSGLQIRMGWDSGWFTLISLIGAAIVVPWGLASAAPGKELPDGFTTTVLVAGLFLVLSVITNLADALGAEGGSGSVLWTSLVFAAAAGFPGWRLNSPVCALLSSAALGVAFFAAIDLIFSPEEIGTFRWIALLLTLAYAAVAVVLLNSRERHAIQHVSAAGLTLLGISFTLYADVIGGAISSAFAGSGSSGVSFNGPVGWELVVLVGSALLIAVAALRREPGPGYIGAFVLSVSVGIAAIPDADVSLIGWPLVFLLLALVAVAVVFSGQDGTAGAGGGRPRAARPRRARAAAAEEADRPRRPRVDDPPAPPPPAPPAAP